MARSPYDNLETGELRAALDGGDLTDVDAAAVANLLDRRDPPAPPRRGKKGA